MSVPAKPNDGSTSKRSPRISAKLRVAVQALVDGEARTNTDAARIAGVSRQYLQKKLNDPAVLRFFQERTHRSVLSSAPRAAAVKRELLECDNAMVRDRASTYVLGVAGIAPNLGPGRGLGGGGSGVAGYVIDLSEPNTPGVSIHIIQAPVSPKAAPDDNIIDVTPNSGDFV